MLDTLASLEQRPLSLSDYGRAHDPLPSQIEPTGVPGFLTSIVSSSLSWIEDEEAKEQIWTAASARLSERSGRTAIPSMMRSFEVPLLKGQTAVVELHEPSLTSDNLGFKTWTSSVLLSSRLVSLSKCLPSSHPRVLELGAGTGLVGIAAACVWGVNVTLTDLPEILPNLRRNIDKNLKLIQSCGGNACALPLDWSDDTNFPETENDRYSVILAADPLYSPDHPQMLANTVQRWLRRTPESSLIIQLPLRPGYQNERDDLKSKLVDLGLAIAAEGYECGSEDWQGRMGEQAEVECWWSHWRYEVSAPDA
jgi:Lysine methyltransferase